jgi:hypothetical protein
MRVRALRTIVAGTHFLPEGWLTFSKQNVPDLRGNRLLQYALRCFAQRGNSKSSELVLLQEIRLTASSAEEAKGKLTAMLMGGRLVPSRFYRFGPSDFSEPGQRDARLELSFFLFQDGRICPIRIWNTAELFGSPAGGSEWTVDFNGLPAWSRMAAVQPEWHRCHPSGSLAVSQWNGTSAHNWQARPCWTISARQLES